MNFLAHAYLSFDHLDIMVGNFIADFVKGNDYKKYPEQVKQGILLHREIDHYTDKHPRVRHSKSKLYTPYSHYAGVIVDMYYDHFLAANFYKFHKLPLTRFTNRVYQTMDNYQGQLPDRAQYILHHMSRGNWMLSYATLEGIERALQGMGRRTRFESGLENAGDTLRENYRFFYQDFMIFFPKAISFAKKKISQL